MSIDEEAEDGSVGRHVSRASTESRWEGPTDEEGRWRDPRGVHFRPKRGEVQTETETRTIGVPGSTGREVE